MSFKNFMIEQAVKVLVELIDKETIAAAVTKAVTEGKNLVDALLDEAKAKIIASENTIDDRLLLPVIEIVERTLGLPEE